METDLAALYTRTFIVAFWPLLEVTVRVMVPARLAVRTPLELTLT